MNFHRSAVLFLATGCNIGRMPFAPGTFGSLLAFLPCYLLALLPLWTEIAIIVCFVIIAIFIADEAEKLLGQKDPGSIVIDEIAGMMVTFAGLPFNGVTAVSGFIIFRILDIAKPFPIRAIEKRLKGGTGIVVDDLVAGIMGNTLFRILFFITGTDA
jgi:phosphatidylglycerophosphatase A